MKIGVALSGGGAKGFAHAGALKALSEYGIVPDVVSGTSAGAVIGAFYCSGYDMDNLVDLFLEHDVWNFIRPKVSKSALLDPEGFVNFLKEELPVNDFSKLKIPLRVVATDFDNGRSVIFSEGEIADKVMASASLPIFFSPRNIDGIHYVDGGLFKNFPASVIRDECDFLIGVNVSPNMKEEYKNSMLYVAARSYNYMFKANMVEDLQMCDLLVEVEEALQYSVFELKKAKEIFHLGYESMKEELSLKMKR